MIELKPLIPGLLGSGLAAVMGPKRGWLDRFIGFLVGASIATFCTLPVLEYFRLAHETYAGGVGFVLGFFGMSIADAGLRVFHDVKWAGILDLIKSRTGG